MSISFDQIPNNYLLPGHQVEFSTERALRGLTEIPHTVMIVGAQNALATVAAESVQQTLNAQDAAVKFGLGSMLHQMVETFRKNDPVTRLVCVGLSDAAATAATGRLDFSGALTSGGTVNLYIAATRIPVTIAGTDTPANAATKVATAIQAASGVPVSAAVDGVTPTRVNLTADFKGEVGNDIDIRLNRFLGEQLPPGLAVATTPMTLGSGNPSIQNALDAVGDDWMNTIICGYADGANLSILKSFLDERWGPLEQIGGHAYVSLRGTYAQLATLGQTHNNEHLTIDGYKAHSSPPWRRAAALGGICAFHGQIDPARPFQTLVMAGIEVNDPGDEFSDTARNLLLFDGISTTKTNDGGDKLRVERVVTTYKKNASGFDDPSLRDLNTKLTLQFLRYSWRAWLAQRYPRHKLAGDGNSFGAGQKVVTPEVLRGTAADWFRNLEERALVEGFDQFMAELQVAINGTDPNRADIAMVPNIVNQFRRSATRVDFIL